ncbi:hypothetical protein RQP54_17640 [Curvibacter sp. APW13]|uniref:hypothetical protein n=1 Tax=Curvibacter sp. APW13 TaxID=3077236 RepID=UPI0028DF2F14|nr:hypothetical protein [Curvibacter sp. APW13]MDT8992699.1 hypothetical protein [Curvibacter sp. APW13]
MKLASLRQLASHVGWPKAIALFLRDIRSQVVSHPARFVALVRAWRAVLVGVGVLGLFMAPLPDFDAQTLDARALAVFTVIAGAALAFTILALTNLLATFNAALMAAGFRAGYLSMLIRIPVAAAIIGVSLQMPGALAYWMLGSLSLITWIVWPSVQQLLAIQEAAWNRFTGFGMTRKALARYKRTVGAEQKQFLAMHEAGHAMFFGLGNVLPEDTFAWIREEVSWNMEEASFGGEDLIGGAVSAFESLSEQFTLFHQTQTSTVIQLGMLVGGMAGEQVGRGLHAPISSGDLDAFEPLARAYLVHYPMVEHGFYLFDKPAGEAEVQHNARVLTLFRQWLLQEAIGFLRANEAVFVTLHRRLALHGELDADALAALLADVVPFGVFQRFVWPSNTPALAWPRQIDLHD